jgi:multicomponent Na+:H+ antiporter subunit G
MSLAVDILAAVLILSGCFFCLVGGVGLIRLPDFYTRTHGASITDTLGAGLLLVGLMLLSGFSISTMDGVDHITEMALWHEHFAFQGGMTLVSVKLLMILVFLLLTSPTAGHALVKAAYAAGVAWTGDDESDDEGGEDGLDH